MVDAERVVELVGVLHGVELTLEGRCPGGEVGAYFARSADGGRLVFKWSQRPERFPVLVDLVEVLGRLHHDGYPLPRYGPVLAIDGGVFIAQEAVDGVVSDVVTHSLLDRLLECNEMQSGRGGPGGEESWRHLQRVARRTPSPPATDLP